MTGVFAIQPFGFHTRQWCYIQPAASGFLLQNEHQAIVVDMLPPVIQWAGPDADRHWHAYRELPEPHTVFDA